MAALLVGTAPFWFLAGHILMAARSAIDRHVPPGWPTKVFLPLGRPFVDLEARWFYPQRTPGKWVTMVGATAGDARAQVAAMDRHVEAVLARLGQSATWPILWYRGSLLGMGRCAIYDMAFGSQVGREWRGADGLTETDRHEVAHCVITRNYTAWSDPPRVLMEGWAQANQGTPAEELADTARKDREKGQSLTLRQLVAPDWYWFSGPTAYNQGAPLVNYLLRVYGPERFLKLYTTCQQATFESDLRACLGVGLDELAAAYWADIERIVRTAGSPALRWLKGMKLAPGIDPAAWEAFLADYFDDAAHLVAPFEHVRLTATFRDTVTKVGRDHPDEYEEGLTLPARVRSPASGRGSGIGATTARRRSWRTPTIRCAPSANSSPRLGPGRSWKAPRPPRCKPTSKPWTGLSQTRAIISLTPLTAGRPCWNTLRISKRSASRPTTKSSRSTPRPSTATAS